jgi:hypothetical protein
MAHDLERLTNFLISLGADTVPHSGSAFSSHLLGVYELLKSWGCPEHVVLAGLFHSIYGTETFKHFSLPLSRRHEVRRVIGPPAERLVYVFSAATWPSFQISVMTGNEKHLRDRFTNTALAVTRQEFGDLLWVHLANGLEQEERLTGERLRRGSVDRAHLWHIVAEKLGATALTGWEEIYGEVHVTASATLPSGSH